jgi:hypothetical protein
MENREKQILDTIISEILETNLIFNDILYKIENKHDYFLTLYMRDSENENNPKKKAIIYYDNFLQVVSYLQGVRKILYLLELQAKESGKDEK